MTFSRIPDICASDINKEIVVHICYKQTVQKMCMLLKSVNTYGEPKQHFYTFDNMNETSMKELKKGLYFDPN